MRSAQWYCGVFHQPSLSGLGSPDWNGDRWDPNAQRNLAPVWDADPMHAALFAVHNHLRIMALESCTA
jgi:hypothetical protein